MFRYSQRPVLGHHPPNLLSRNPVRYYSHGYRSPLSSPNAATVLVGGTIAGCFYVHYYRRGALEKDFILSEQAIKEKRWWTLITHTFCHRDLGHLAGNMWGVFVFGLPVALRYGATGFASLWIGAGVTGGVASLALSKQSEQTGLCQIRRQYLGASGSVLGLLTAYACTYPHAQLFIFPLVSGLFLAKASWTMTLTAPANSLSCLGLSSRVLRLERVRSSS